MRPALEVADIFRRHGDAFRATQGESLSHAQRRVMSAIEICRTAALGGHVERCSDCAFTRIAYNSCLMGNAIIMLLARLGLRAGDVAQLRVADIEWETSTLRVSGKGHYQVRLPLSQEVGDAILDYAECRPPV